MASEPNHERLTEFAMRQLEDALAQAGYGTVPRTWGHRLALAWMARIGVAKDWQCADFWQAMADPYTCQMGDYPQYIRTVALTGYLRNWYHGLGWAEPGVLQRSRWSRRYAPPIDALDGEDQLSGMCNRYQPGERHRIEKLFSAPLLRDVNEGPATIHPKSPGWVVRLDAGALVLDQMTWGFPVVLTGKKGQKLKPKPVNNARFDKLAGFWSRWATLPEHRCLIPTARFAEAVGSAGSMTETWLSVRDEPVFAWAGLWSQTEEWGACYTGVMTNAAPELVHIHDRAPVIVETADWQTWLTAPLADLYRFDRPLPASRLDVQSTTTSWWSR